ARPRGNARSRQGVGVDVIAVLWLGIPSLIALGLGLLPRPTRRRTAAILMAPVLLAVLYLAVIYLSAPTSPPEGGCGECSLAYGRWWDPGLVVLFLAVPALVWVLTALVALYVRAVFVEPRLQRTRAAK